MTINTNTTASTSAINDFPVYRETKNNRGFTQHLLPYSISSAELDMLLHDIRARTHYSVHTQTWARLANGKDVPIGCTNGINLDYPDGTMFLGWRTIVSHIRTGYVAADYIEWMPL